ncbi:hypothetical protein TSUD_414060 [Trifolium subterraneum]|uniref:Uncharacterized protein n=1 Tax=Trifolium subterraneum TaxID=3900 RepID=A0A2Z6PKY8_TRISU|nr:hypothetical protein TSUD_414060 [Trifolium subterraneum]
MNQIPSFSATKKHDLDVSDLNTNETSSAASDLLRPEFQILNHRFSFSFSKVDESYVPSLQDDKDEMELEFSFTHSQFSFAH